MIEVTVEAAAGRVPVVAGTGALSTRETVELSVHAERAGAAAVMVVPPFYEALQLARAARPLHGRGRGDLDPDHVLQPPERLGREARRGAAARAAARRRVTWLKDTGGDAIAATELIQAGDDGPTLLNGWDTLTFAALAAGVRAVVWGTASILPEQCVELHRLLIDDIDLPAARELWARLWPLCHFLESQSYSAAVKTACALVGDSHRPGARAAAAARRGRRRRARQVCSSARGRAGDRIATRPSSRGRTRIIGTSSPERVSGYTT